METIIRKYTEVDKTALIELIQLNTPQYFSLSETEDFVLYLDKYIEDYFVIETENIICGCGGINFEPNKAVARLSWDLIHPTYHGLGIGTMLTQFRINHIKQMQGIKTIVVRTSQLAYKFYEKFGFTKVDYQKDYWAPGFDLYKMVLIIKK